MVEMEIIEMIKSVGFPIFVVLWLLLRSDRKEEATQKAIEDNTIIMTQLKNIIELKCMKKDNL